MLKSTFILCTTLLCAAPATWAQGLLPTTGLQETKPDEPQKTATSALPKWVVPLSNLSAEDRQAYMLAFQKAKIAYNAGDLLSCEAHLNTCETYFRQNPHVWLLRSGIHINLKQFDKALPYIRQARQSEPDNNVATLQLSIIALAQGKYDESIQLCQELLNLPSIRNAPLSMQHLLVFRQFLCLIMQNKIDEAKKHIAHIDPLVDSPLYYYTQAVFLMLDGKFKAATLELNTADRIYYQDVHLSGFKQNIELSGIKEKVQAQLPPQQ